ILMYSGSTTEKEKNILLPSSVFRYGISNTVELRMVHEYNIQEFSNDKDKGTEAGIGDLQLGAKLFILDSEKTQISFLSHLVLPTGNTFFTHDDYAVKNKLILGHVLGPKVGIAYNLGYDYFDESTFTYSFALNFNLTKDLLISIEPYGSFDDEGDHLSNFNTGLIYLLKNNLQFDFSFGLGMNNTMNYTSVGISWNIPR
ncbi:MAG: transporter, partial [Saprospiraceae bacterium]|nr:transporter [Saprospiraceae bacterium]